MQHMNDARIAVGQRIRALREERGLSRQQFADQLEVDVTAVAAWEAGKYSPRARYRNRIATLLGADAVTLFDPGRTDPAAPTATLVDTVTELADLLIELARRKPSRLRAVRLAAPYATAAHIQCDFRQLVAEQLLSGSLSVQRVEIFYSLDRLKEVLSNILRYDGRPYWVKSYCAGVSEVVPAMGGYYFDETDFLIGAYWTSIPPDRRPGLHLTGEAPRAYFNNYWDEIWRRGELLNIKGAHDLSAIRKVALALGLSAGQWPAFVEEARTLEVGDGAPPLV
jgi:transcriptional regulator with XRE-family HTH domain